MTAAEPPRTVDAKLVRTHLRTVMNARISLDRAAAMSGVSPSTLNQIVHRGTTRTRADIAAKILAIIPPPPDAEPAGYMRTDATGSRRRVKSLHWDGYDAERIGAELNIAPRTVANWFRTRWIDAAIAEALTDLFNRWSGIPAETNGATTAAAAAARALARQRRWPPAGAWDPEALDDPAAEPTPYFGFHRAADLFTDSQEILAQGFSLDVAAERLGVTVANLKRARERVKARVRAAAHANDGPDCEPRLPVPRVLDLAKTITLTDAAKALL